MVARIWCLLSVVALCGLVSTACAKGPVVVDPKQAGPEFKIQGEYVGQLKLDGQAKPYGMQVVALGSGQFEAVLYHGGLPGAGWTRQDKKQSIKGTMQDTVAYFDAGTFNATVFDNLATFLSVEGDSLGDLRKTHRESPTLGARPPAGAIVLFDGGNTDAWINAAATDDGLLDASRFAKPGALTRQEFRDYTLHLEFRTPFMPEARGQGRGNSGVYLNNRYEIQVLDSFGLEGKSNECGGIYGAAEPEVNMCLPPLAWQTYDIEFTAPRFDQQGNKTANARVTVKHNGVVIHQDREVPRITPGGAGQEPPGIGPIQLQNHGNPVHFRNIWIVERKAND